MLAGATQAIGALRTAAKPLHPDGEVYAGGLARRGTAFGPHTGVPWIDEPGADDVVVRLSRAVGLPDGVPDIHGLALRVLGPDGPADVLFANTGTRRLTRFALTASRHPRARPMTTLLPYRAPSGPVLLRVDSAGPGSYELSWARPSSRWHPFATLHVDERLGDPTVSFDPIVHRLPGLAQYPAVLRLREPAYRRARRSRAS
ncbi:hypothetical protein GON03_21915 [Nocardioides sp. MAH-18]|uniref:Phosphodiesterase n=1 Tax=Nocardioides agri TaxID=2682843 RepID=A0A6L6Y2M3_9ACTN|nr:hypothetical protein [Nocardioides sp. CGMCC 1.13656]MVQ51845.1 hypothetical protein [Nocardioides sp. MAH-18]